MRYGILIAPSSAAATSAKPRKHDSPVQRAGFWKAKRARAESPAQKAPVFPCRRAVGAHGFLHPISLGFAQGCYAAAPLALKTNIICD
jgi:hypothetical protein